MISSSLEKNQPLPFDKREVGRGSLTPPAPSLEKRGNLVVIKEEGNF